MLVGGSLPLLPLPRPDGGGIMLRFGGRQSPMPALSEKSGALEARLLGVVDVGFGITGDLGVCCCACCCLSFCFVGGAFFFETTPFAT